MNKYGNRKVTVDGYVFDSALEAKRHRQLVLLERAGEIKDLRLQVPFELQEAFEKNGVHHRAITYKADFVYYDNKLKQTIVEDTKGMKTEVFKMKQKMFERKYLDLTIKIVTKNDV